MAISHLYVSLLFFGPTIFVIFYPPSSPASWDLITQLFFHLPMFHEAPLIYPFFYCFFPPSRCSLKLSLHLVLIWCQSLLDDPIQGWLKLPQWRCYINTNWLLSLGQSDNANSNCIFILIQTYKLLKISYRRFRTLMTLRRPEISFHPVLILSANSPFRNAT